MEMCLPPPQYFPFGDSQRLSSISFVLTLRILLILCVPISIYRQAVIGIHRRLEPAKTKRQSRKRKRALCRRIGVSAYRRDSHHSCVGSRSSASSSASSSAILLVAAQTLPPIPRRVHSGSEARCKRVAPDRCWRRGLPRYPKATRVREPG
jgi:hypothetical protein